jgi:hypothetical protein
MSYYSTLYELLTDDAALVALTGGRIYPDEAPQGTKDYPVVVYRQTGNVPTDDHDGPSELDFPRFDIFVYSGTRSGCDAAAAAVRQAIDGVSTTDVACVWFVDGFSDLDTLSGLYFNASEYKLALNR